METAFALAALVALLAALGVIVRGLYRRVSAGTENGSDRPSGFVPAVADEPRCLCGEPATEPTPRLERGRGSVIRDLLAMPPRYRRVVNQTDTKVFCKSHAHVADAELASFCATEIRAAFLRGYANVATRVAAFEQEELPQRVQGSLTELQRKAAKRPALSSLRMVKNGTDDASPG